MKIEWGKIVKIVVPVASIATAPKASGAIRRAKTIVTRKDTT